jgi:hypothetical protein
MTALKEAESLAARAGRWRKALADSATGPLIIASEIVQLADEWADHQSETDGLSCTSWLRATLGRGRSLAWFATRHAAVATLGEACRRTIHHEVACYVARNVPGESRDAVRLMLMRECKAQNNNPLTMAQARRKIEALIGRVSAPRCAAACTRCAHLEQVILAAGLALP